MHMTKNQNEAHNQYSLWSACLMLVTAFAIADTFAGGLLKEALVISPLEYATAFALVIATIGAYAVESPPGVRFIRAYSRHKL
jgi:hypothetical protein